MSTVRQSPHAGLLRAGSFFFRFRDFLFPVVLVCLALAAKPKMPFGRASQDILADVLGIAVAISGQVLRALVIGYAYIKRGGKDKKIYADTLVQEGFFAHSRNPLYLGNILILLGLIIIHGSVWLYLVGLPFFLFAYWTIVLAEEDFLAGKFGQTYQDYCRRVNRFIPSVVGLGRTLEGMEFDWKRLIRKEYGSTFTWVTTVLALLGWEAYIHFGYQARKAEIHLLAILWVPVIAAWLTARILKKRGVLGSG